MSDFFNKIHESPITMSIPLAFLALGSIFSGVFLSDYFIGSKVNDFWFASIILSHNEHHLPFLQALIIIGRKRLKSCLGPYARYNLKTVDGNFFF